VSKSKEIYHTKNTDSRVTKRNVTEKLSTETEKQTNWAFMENHFWGEKAKVLKYFFKRSMEISHLRDYEQT